MKKRITKEDKAELKGLVLKKGYWSDEVYHFIDKFHGNIKNSVHNLALKYSRENEN